MTAPIGKGTGRSGAFRYLDWILISSAVAVAGFGTLMVYSATRNRLDLAGEDAEFFLFRQIAWVLLGIGVMALLIAIDYQVLRDVAPVLYAGTVVVLLLVLSPLGTSTLGSQSRFGIGPFQLQPSEFAKVVLIVGLASFAYQYREGMDAWRLAQALAITAVPMGLILMQPDVGTTMVIGVILLAVALVAGARPRYLLVLVLFGVTSVAALISAGALEDYQVERLTGFLDQSADVQRSTYNLNQSKIAVGSGRLLGTGLFEGTQTNLAYVPEQHTDFVFTVVGEELGFAGAATLLALFAIIMWRTWRSAQHAKDLFGSLVSVGVFAFLVFQVFQNVGMSMGIMPITGIPLPFMSYGGSATIASFAAVGLAANVGMRRFT